MSAQIVLFRRFDGGVAQALAVVAGQHPLQRREERLEASPTNMQCLTAFTTPHDRMLRDSYCLRRPSRPRHPFSDNYGRFTRLSDDSTGFREAFISLPRPRLVLVVEIGVLMAP